MPQNVEYLVLGLAVVAAIMSAYVTSLIARFAAVQRALARTERTLEK
ncbi:MAG: hypothetical protein RML95_07450 [Anaerolineae bacterium]|nr:hypothetical protein [Anaerolineae bacterium]MDW8299159.1 hypothetical protein [Anaerolineae bacterium]